MQINENCDYYLEYEKVIKNNRFIFECLKCGEKSFYLISYNDSILKKRSWKIYLVSKKKV